MSGYEAGTVAVATVHGIPDVRVMRTTGIGGGDVIWLTAEQLKGTRLHLARDVTDIRPLPVLDLNDAPRNPLSVVEHLRELASEGEFCALADWIADQVEAQVKPPKPDEPGLGGVVVDAAGKEWVRAAAYRARWLCAADGKWDDYDRIDVVRVLSEGVQR